MRPKANQRYLVVITTVLVMTLMMLWSDVGVTRVATSLLTSKDVISNQPRTDASNSKPPSGNITSPQPKPQYRIATNLSRRATIIVGLSGEMANNLHHIAHALGLRLWARDEFGIDCNLVLRHFEGPNNRSPKPKWKSARDAIQQCFPKLANWSFGRGNSRDFQQRARLQKAWLQGRSDHMMGLVNSANSSEIREGLKFLQDILTDAERPYVEESSDLQLPYLLSESLDAFPMIDRYYTQIRDLLEFNNSCCAQVPEAGDSVFHFRNYVSEMPERRAYEMGFAELSPQKVAHELFGNLQAGRDYDRVMITTRVYNQIARNYAEALEERGVSSSIVTGQSGMQDFCYLKQSQKELVGSARSTFVMWAGLLGNATRVRLYHVDNWGLRQRHPNYWERFTYSWTNKDLQERVGFELYRAEEMDER